MDDFFAPEPVQRTLFQEGMRNDWRPWVDALPEATLPPLYVPNVPNVVAHCGRAIVEVFGMQDLVKAGLVIVENDKPFVGQLT